MTKVQAKRLLEGREEKIGERALIKILREMMNVVFVWRSAPKWFFLVAAMSCA